MRSGTGSWGVDIRPEDTPWQLWGKQAADARCKLDSDIDFRGRSALMRALDGGFAYKCYRFSVAEYKEVLFVYIFFFLIKY